MKGTFRTGDVLIAGVVAPERVRIGDVLVFYPSSASGVIVHRVVARVLEGFIMQGDALHLPDAAPVATHHMLGRVVRVQRGNRVLPVAGGWRGRLWAGCLHLWRRLLTVGSLPYRVLRASGVVHYLWHPPVTQVSVATAHGCVVKYLSAGKTIATWRSWDRSFWCQKPYDLVLKPPGNR